MQKIELKEPPELSDLDKEKALQFLTGVFQTARVLMRIFFLFGMGLSIFGGIFLWKALSSQTWPSVKGKIISATLEQGKVRGRVISREKIQYEYHVEGKRFVGERVSMGPRLLMFGLSAEQVIKKYPKNMPVTVYYNPSRPEKSVLEPGLNPYVVLIAAVGPFILLIVSISYRYSIQLESSARLKLKLPGEKGIPPKTPVQVKPPSFEPTRKWIIILLAALLLVLLAIQFYGDEIQKWYEGVRKEYGVEVSGHIKS